MSPRQSRWINVIIIAFVIILRLPTLLPSLYNGDEGYYGIIASDTLDGGTFYQTAADTSPPGIYYVYLAVFKVAGKNNFLAVHVLAIVVVAVTALVVRRIGAQMADDWAGAWSGIGYAVFVHAYRPGDTLGANVEIFASLFLALSILTFLQGKGTASGGGMFLSGTLVGMATLIRLPAAVTLGAMLGYLVYVWFVTPNQSLGRVLISAMGVVTGFITVIAALALCYEWQGNLHDAYLWVWVFAFRYVESETTFVYILKRLATVHVAVMLCWGLLWCFGIRQVIETLRSFRRRKAVPAEHVLLTLWLVLSYLAIFIGWRFPGHYHLAVLPPLSILGGQAFSHFVAVQRHSPQPGWRWIRTGIIGAAAVPAIGFLIMAFAVRTRNLDFLPVAQHIVKATSPNDRVFVWGTSPQLYCFSDRRMATRFVSCSHLVGVHAGRPRQLKDRGENIPEGWKMFQADWEAHPPALIIDTSTIDPVWSAHPMTRYPLLRDYLREYRVETVINGRTIYRRL